MIIQQAVFEQVLPENPRLHVNDNHHNITDLIISKCITQDVHNVVAYNVLEFINHIITIDCNNFIRQLIVDTHTLPGHTMFAHCIRLSIHSTHHVYFSWQ